LQNRLDVAIYTGDYSLHSGNFARINQHRKINFPANAPGLPGVSHARDSNLRLAISAFGFRRPRFRNPSRRRRDTPGAQAMTIIALPWRRTPRVFIEAEADLHGRVSRALASLGDLPDELALPGLDVLAEALITLADELDGEADCELDADLEAITEDDF
jgi:hypothetical protein